MRNPESNPILSVHVEKTAGTSLQGWWLRLFGKNQVLLYNPTTDRLYSPDGLWELRSNADWDRLRKIVGSTFLYPAIHRILIQYLRKQSPNTMAPEQAQDVVNLQVIHGHFSADRFGSIFPDARLTIVLREPLDRMISHYLGWRRAHGETLQRVKIPFNPQMPFTTFALLPQLQNFQTKALGSKELSGFWVVGTTEKLGDFMDQVIASGNLGHLIKDHKPVPQLNQAPRRENHDQLGITDAFRRTFERQHHLDYQLYAIASEK